jgi:uncharacterized protein DUF6338
MELDLGQPATQIAAAILFLVPGLNATWFLERLRGPNRLRGTERLLRALSLSLLIYVSASPWLVGLGQRVLDLRPVSPWELILGGFVLVFIAPLLLALVAALLGGSSKAKWLLGLVATIDPIPRAWDFAFKAERPFFVRIKLRDGERVGGVFGEDSFAAAYPEPQDVFLEEVWRLSRDGSFVEPLEGTAGLLVPETSIDLVELLTAEEVTANE